MTNLVYRQLIRPGTNYLDNSLTKYQGIIKFLINRTKFKTKHFNKGKMKIKRKQFGLLSKIIKINKDLNNKLRISKYKNNTNKTTK